MKLKSVKAIYISLSTIQCFSLNVATANPLHSRALGLLWVGPTSRPATPQDHQIERNLVFELENQLGRRVVRHPLRQSVPLEVFRSWELVKSLKKHSTDLWNMIHSGSEEERAIVLQQGRPIYLRMRQILGKLNRGMFGPEIQEARVVLAAWFLFQGDKTQSAELVHEASKLHPQGKVIWERESSSPFGHVFEAWLQDQLQKINSRKCRITGEDEDRKSNRLWMNGFLLKGPLRSIQSGRHLLNSMDSQGSLFEELVVCEQEDVLWDKIHWAPIATGVRLEQWFLPEQLSYHEVVLLFPSKDEIKKIISTPGKEMKPFILNEWILRPETFKETPFLNILNPTTQKKEDLLQSPRLSLTWLVVGVAAALGVGYSVFRGNESPPALIPVTFTREK